MNPIRDEWQTEDGSVRLLLGDCINRMGDLPDASVNCCVTSPPYWGLRDYNVDGQIGLEKTPEEYVARMVEVFREVRRVLRDDGTLWLNLGDSYAGSGPSGASYQSKTTREREGKNADGAFRISKTLAARGLTYAEKKPIPPPGLKPKDLCGIPWRVAFALQADGWWLRQDIIWCLSGGTWVYARTQKGDMPVTVKDLSRLNPATVQLWNGEKWTQLLGMSKSARRGDELEIVLRSGERISCTPTHRFPASIRRGGDVECGVYDASELRPGDCLASCRLPGPELPRDCAIDQDAAWFAGLYIAEGSRSQDTIQISGHAKELERWDRVQAIARKFGGSATQTVDGNNMAIRVYGKVLNAIIDELVTGRTAKDKGFSPVVWRYSDGFVAAMLDGYLSGDGSKDGTRWRLGFCRNYNLERDLRTACARLGYVLTLNLSTADYKGKKTPAFRGELRKCRSGHHNERDRNEIVEIRKARCREVYDLGVADEPHLFALASGVLTHNSKPNPMPESVTDRCTKAHEYVFLLSKSAKYWYDAEAVSEAFADERMGNPGGGGAYTIGSGRNDRGALATGIFNADGERTTRNRRSVWTISTKPYSGAHFAVMPSDLVEPCILAGCPEGGTVLDPFNGSGTTGEVALKHGRRYVGCELNPDYVGLSLKRIRGELDKTALIEAPRKLVQRSLIGE